MNPRITNKIYVFVSRGFEASLLFGASFVATMSSVFALQKTEKVIKEKLIEFVEVQ